MKVGIIGIGKLGSIHLRIYRETKGIDTIFLVDTDESKLSAYQEHPCFQDYKCLVGKVDCVSIATPTTTHFKIAKFFLEHKIPVLVEKPITESLVQAHKLLAVAKKHKTLIFVGHVERYNNAYRAVKKLINKPLFIECHRLSPYPFRSLDISVVLDLMIHDLDIILDLVHDKIKRIDAKGVKVLSKTPDIANVRIAFHKGCVANITASRISAKKERKIRIFLPDCYISLDYAEQKAEIYQKIGHEIKNQLLPITKEEPLKKEIEDFVDLVRNKTLRWDDALRAKDALKLALHINSLISR